MLDLFVNEVNNIILEINQYEYVTGLQNFSGFFFSSPEIQQYMSVFIIFKLSQTFEEDLLLNIL